MSVHISSAVWSNRSLKGNQKFVLLKFADLADDDGANSWPSVGRVAAETGLHERTIQRIIVWLLEHGYLAIQSPEGVEHPSRTYRVIPDPPAKRHPRQPGVRSATRSVSDPISLDPDLSEKEDPDLGGDGWHSGHRNVTPRHGVYDRFIMRE